MSTGRASGVVPTTEGVPLPAAVAEELIGYGLQTVPGKALWRGYLLGAGLPQGDGQITVVAARYQPGAPGAPEEETAHG